MIGKAGPRWNAGVSCPSPLNTAQTPMKHAYPGIVQLHKLRAFAAVSRHGNVQIGRATCRESECQSVEHVMGPGSLKKQHPNNYTTCGVYKCNKQTATE